MSTNDLGTRFRDAAFQQLREVSEKQADAVSRAADASYDCLESGGVLHAFGTGHSAAGAMEMFHRAGGLVPVNGILEASLSPFSPPVEAAAAERTPGLGGRLVEEYDVRSGEVLFLFSQSGINAVPIDAATAARERGATTVAITCLRHSQAVKPRHPSGQRLFEAADIAIDNHGSIGDAAVDWGDDRRTAATSGVAAAFIANWIVAEIVARYIRDSAEPPVYVSANVPGGDEHNRALEARFASRIRGLKPNS